LGTNGRLSFYQLVHQGTKLIPTDYIGPATSLSPIEHSKLHRILLTNFFAQSEALAFGKTEEEVKKELGPDASEALIKSMVFKGNMPSASIMFPLLAPATLGECFFFSLSLWVGSVNRTLQVRLLSIKSSCRVLFGISTRLVCPFGETFKSVR
jgi:glucose-6-phosphate isomerase